MQEYRGKSAFMRKSGALRASLLILGLAGAALIASFGTASAGSKTQGPDPVFFTARAVPTQSQENVKITIFARSADRLSVSVDGEDRQKATPRGLGCAPFSCRKWIVYHVRSRKECYDLNIKARNVRSKMTFRYTVCEPFRNGEV